MRLFSAAVATVVVLVACAGCTHAAASVRSANLAAIAAHNHAAATGGAGAPTYTLGPNRFWDMTPAQFQSRMLRRVTPVSRYGRDAPSPAAATSLPTSVDWRTHGVLPAVMNQGAMGSSVPMVVTTAVEANAAVASGKLVTANPEYLANCATGCDPNFGVDCFLKFAMQEGGLCTGDGKSCQCSDRIKVSSYHNLQANNTVALMTAVAAGPTIALVDASSWQFYSGGVINQCGKQLDHVVLVAGYGTTASGQDYWIVMNSWGADWGEHGYAYLLRGTPENPIPGGECAILEADTSVSASN